MGSYGGGLVRIKDGKFTCFTRTQGLFSNVVYQILEDNHGYLWMGSLDGISCVSKQMLNDFADAKIDSIQCTAYTTSDGMVSGDCSGNAQSAGCKISDGRLFFATAGGIVVIDPSRIHKNLLPPPVMIERVVINKADHSPFSENIYVPVGSGQVEFHFGGLSYCVPEKVNFRYKLEGFDTEWQSVGTRHEAYYTNLSPGNYIFHVTACNNDGLWNEKGASFAFELEPRFYQTYWFYGLVFITLGGTVFGAYRLRVRQLLERKNELEQYVLEREKAEDALAEERNLLRTLIDNMPDRIYAKDLESRFIICNKALAARMGTANPDEIVGKSDFDFLPHDLAEKFRNDELVIIQSGQPLINCEEPMDNSTGETRWNLATKVPLRDNQGNIIGIVGLGRDITERKHAEEALKESEKRYRYLVEHSPNSIAIHREEKFIYVNAAAIKLFGAKDSAELIGRSFFNFIHPDYKETVHQRILKALEESKAIPLTEEKFLRLDGGVVDVEVVTLPIILEGKPAMQVVANDITERKKLQQELAQSQKMQSIGTLAGGIAHDFNNILNIILGYTTLLYKYKSDDQKFSESITAISQTVQRAAALVRQILTFARKTDVSIEPINLIDLVHELVTMLKQTFPKIIIFREEFQKDIPSIHADHTQVHQAILNLCVNARDAMPNGGTITMKVEQQLKEQVMERIPAADQDSYVCISVTDTGEGMDEATRLRVFDPFFTTKPPGKGTGMGLSVVYGAIQAHHGYVQVESELGHGTTFRLYFPAQSISKQKVDSTQPIESFEIGGTETILLVEDEEFLLDLVHLMLESKGYKVYSAKDGVEALELYESHKQEINLVFSDMGLPGLTGIDEFRKFKELDPSVKVVFASGFFETNIKSDLLKAGVKGFIQKPYMTDEILQIVRKVLDEKRA
jgi:PAS domain S-box-containing protein